LNYNRLDSIDFGVWNRKIISGFWLVFFLYFAGQVSFLILNIVYYPEYAGIYYIRKHMIVPDTLLLSILVSAEIFIRRFKNGQKYLVLITSIVVAYTIFFTISSRIPGRQIVLILPMIISIFYFNKKISVIGCCLNIIVFSLVYILIPYQRTIISIYEFVVIILMLVGSATAGIAIVNRGIQLLNEITKLVKSEEKLIIENSIIDKLSKTDALTELYNHKTFHEFTDNILAQCDSHELPLQLALFDIDNFKKVNDTYGHWTGDIVLKQVANIIHNSITINDFIARYGGEEFAVIFIGKNMEETLAILENIRATIEKTIFKELENKAVTVSIGVQSYKKNDGKESLFKFADAYLYTAKTSGKNIIVSNNL
jgi:diguanylate cyclase (GGDEF)-like protein